MTIHEAKKDAAKRLTDAGIMYSKITAKTVSFSGFGYDEAIFVAIHGAKLPPDWGKLFEDVPKPSEGGYIAEKGRA